MRNKTRHSGAQHWPNVSTTAMACGTRESSCSQAGLRWQIDARAAAACACASPRRAAIDSKSCAQQFNNHYNIKIAQMNHKSTCNTIGWDASSLRTASHSLIQTKHRPAMTLTELLRLESNNKLAMTLAPLHWSNRVARLLCPRTWCSIHFKSSSTTWLSGWSKRRVNLEAARFPNAAVTLCAQRKKNPFKNREAFWKEGNREQTG